jgi:hypothetical protein
VIAMSLPTEADIERVRLEVEELKAYLLAPADKLFEFKPQFLDDTLHFRKLSYPELLVHTPKVHIPPRFSKRTWAKDEFETLSEEMKKYWRSPCDPSPQESELMRKSQLTMLTLTNGDGKKEQDWMTYGPLIQNECFTFLSKISGFSDDAMELLDWFRQQQ